jgi:hypothetical protein
MLALSASGAIYLILGLNQPLYQRSSGMNVGAALEFPQMRHLLAETTEV